MSQQPPGSPPSGNWSPPPFPASPFAPATPGAAAPNAAAPQDVAPGGTLAMPISALPGGAAFGTPPSGPNPAQGFAPPPQAFAPQGYAPPAAAGYAPQGYAPPGFAPHAPSGAAPPWGAAQGSFPPAPAYAAPGALASSSPGAYRPPPAPGGALSSSYGDRAGEHLGMQHGRYSAWPYVVIAFLMQIALTGAAFGAAGYAIADGAGADEDNAVLVALIAGGAIGLVFALFTFRDRWRCIEAFSSRFCSGLMNLSIVYVPVVALVYANVRGVKKLRGR